MTQHSSFTRILPPLLVTTRDAVLRYVLDLEVPPPRLDPLPFSFNPCFNRAELGDFFSYMRLSFGNHSN
jgi:hypothetical protein